MFLSMKDAACSMTKAICFWWTTDPLLLRLSLNNRCSIICGSPFALDEHCIFCNALLSGCLATELPNVSQIHCVQWPGSSDTFVVIFDTGSYCVANPLLRLIMQFNLASNLKLMILLPSAPLELWNRRQYNHVSLAQITLSKGTECRAVEQLHSNSCQLYLSIENFKHYRPNRRIIHHPFSYGRPHCALC